MTAPKLAQIRFSLSQTKLVILTFYFIAFGFPQAMEVIEPISAHLINAIWDFIQHARTAILRKTAVAKSQCDFSRNVFCDFVAIFFRKFAIVWQALDAANDSM